MEIVERMDLRNHVNGLNVLLTSVGRRAYLVKYFKEAVKDFGGKVHCCNSDEYSVAFLYADYYVKSPLIYSNDYIPFLLYYCRENHIQMLLSVFDIDLPILAANKDKFLKIGTTVVVSDSHFISICNDKWKTSSFLTGKEFAHPKTWLGFREINNALLKKEAAFPVIVKPRFGCGSIGVYCANNMEDLKFYNNKVRSIIRETYLKYEAVAENEVVIFQERVQGAEYGVDIINDLKRNFRTAYIKRKISMRAGETDIAVTEKNDLLLNVMSRLGEVTKHIGVLDCDVILSNDNAYILDMNARFGGGYPFSHKAGADIPRALIEWYLGNEPSEELLSVRDNVVAYKELIITAQEGANID